MLQQQLGGASVIQNGVDVLHGNDLSEKALSPACESGNVQELDCEIPAAGTTSSLSSEDHRMGLSQYVHALLEEGLFEKALSLSCECYRDPALGKDTVFLETALVLFTNLEKLDMMWTEVKNLDSMQRLYPVAKSLSQYYMPAALLTAEMLLCKEWCEKTISLSDLQKATTLWVSLLWSQCGHNHEAFQTKVLQVGKLIIHEPTFILNLVKSVHAEVERQSLVICVNLCVMALQEPLKDPQSNLVRASRIDTNNAALCNFLSELLTEDTSLRRLCLLTAFTITPTKELLAEVDRVYKSVAVRIPDVPLMPSCLNCVLVHGMYSLLPDVISPLVEWRELRGKCLKYLRDSSELNVQVKLPNREMALKVYVKKVTLDNNEDEDKGCKSMKPDARKNGRKGSSEEAHQDLPRLRTESEQRWLATMMSLDMSWHPHWLSNSDKADNQQATPGLTESQNQCQSSPEFGVGSDVAPPDQEEIPQCSVVLCNFKDTLLGHFHLLENRVNDDQSQSTVEEDPDVCETTALQEDHAYSLPPTSQDTPISNKEHSTSQEMSITDVKNHETLDIESSEKDPHYDNLVTRGLNGMQLTAVIPVEDDSPNSDRNRHNTVFHSYKQEHVDPTVERCLDSLAIELSYLEERSELEKSPENEDRSTDEGTELEVHQNFLADLKDDVIDPELPVLNQVFNGSINTEDEPPSDLIADISRWFQNIKQPSEASSIVGSDVTPDPVTEEGMQWSAIKAISENENQTLYESGWNDLWFSEDDDIKRTAPPNPAVSPSVTGASLLILGDSDSLENRNCEADSGRELWSLESTINRLRANLCAVDSGHCKDQWVDLPEVASSSPPTSSLETPLGKSSKQQQVQLNVFSQQSYHQLSIDGQSPKVDQSRTNEQSTKQQVFNQRSFIEAVSTTKPSTSSPKSTDPQSVVNGTLNQLSFDQQANCLTAGNSTNQQYPNQPDPNQPSDNPLPVTKHAISQGSSSKLPADRWEDKAKVEPTKVSNDFMNIKHNDLIRGTGALVLHTTSTNSLQQPSSHSEAVLHPDHPRNDKDISNSQSVDAFEQYNEPVQGLFKIGSSSRSSTCTSAGSCIVTVNPDIEKESEVSQTCEEKTSLEQKQKTDLGPQYDVISSMSAPESHSMNSSIVYKTTRTNSEFEEIPSQNESRTRLLDSLLSFAVQEYRQITGSSADADTTMNADTVKTTPARSLAKEDHNFPLQLSSQTSKDCNTANISENPIVTAQMMMHSGILNAPADLLSGVELSPEHKPDQFQNGLLAVSNTEPYTTEASGWRNAGYFDLSDNSNAVKLLGQGDHNNCNPQLLEADSQSSNDKEFQSDSDCGDFEVVQDVSSRWSVSGTRKTLETYSWPEKAGSGQLPEIRSRKMSRTQSPEISENKTDTATKKATVSCSTPPLKEEIHHLQEPERSCMADETQAPKLAAKEKSKSNASAGKVKEIASPHSHRYNLRAADRPVNYFVASSGTDPSSETSGEERGTKKSYNLRSASAHSNNAKSSTSRTPKKPTCAFKSMQTRSRTHKSRSRSTCSCSTAVGKKAGGLAKLGTKHRFQNAASKFISDLNNNCSGNNMGSIISDHVSGGTFGSAADKKPPSTIHPKAASSKLTLGVHGKFSAIKNPQLPWEARPPLRTYSSKRKLSSAF